MWLPLCLLRNQNPGLNFQGLGLGILEAPTPKSSYITIGHYSGALIWGWGVLKPSYQFGGLGLWAGCTHGLGNGKLRNNDLQA